MKKKNSINRMIICVLCLFTYAYATNTTSAQAIYDKLEKDNISIQYFGKITESPDEKVLIYTIHDKQSKITTRYFSLFKDDTFMYAYSPNTESYGFFTYFENFKWMSLNDGETYVALTWSIGAHSELFVLLDPRNKKVVQEIAASWPVSIKSCNNGFVVGIPLEVNSNGIGIFQLSYWGENNVTKTLQVKSLDEDDLCKQIGH